MSQRIKNLKQLYQETARRVDTVKTKIDVADTSRVCAKLFEVLSELDADEAIGLLADGIARHKEKF